MKWKSLKPLFFMLVILIIILSYAYYIISLNPVETEEETEIIEEIVEPIPLIEEEIVEPIPLIEEEIVEPEEKEITIEIKSGYFEPDEVIIPVGTTVTWVNDDRRPHGVTDPRRNFYESRILPGETYSFTFTEEGVYNYFDVVFYQVKGKITVKSDSNLITGSAVLGKGNPKLAGVSVLLLTGVILAFVLSRKK